MSTVVIESHVPFVGDAFAGVADVRILPPEEITPAAVRDADALIVRTRTRCDASLLDRSAVKLVCTATIGTDHIDKDYCASRGIRVVSAPGCNAPAVAQWVWASIMALRPVDWRSLTLGVVGVGNVGSIVADWADRLGVKLLVCDPPRQRAGDDSRPWMSLDRIGAEADSITFHTPHTLAGPDATHHLADKAFFDSLKRRPLLMNAARGPIVDTEALLAALDGAKVSQCAIDCWEGEPAIDGRLLKLAAVATPHIAGYSVEGKRRATQAVVNATLGFFGAQPGFSLDVPCGHLGGISAEAIAGSYDPMADTAALKAAPADFEILRNNYALRHEVNCMN